MFRALYSGARLAARVVNVPAIPQSVIAPKNYSAFIRHTIFASSPINTPNLSQNLQVLSIAKTIGPVRTLVKCSLSKGKRRTQKVVIKSFFRLHWGGWIRTKCGRHKKMWKKSSARKRRLRQHVLCNKQQSLLLDKMVTKYWKRPKYYVDDPYAPYHTREEFHATRKAPIDYDALPNSKTHVARKV